MSEPTTVTARFYDDKHGGKYMGTYVLPLEARDGFVSAADALDKVGRLGFSWLPAADATVVCPAWILAHGRLRTR